MTDAAKGAERDPLDHDNDGRKGGSVKAQAKTATPATEQPHVAEDNAASNVKLDFLVARTCEEFGAAGGFVLLAQDAAEPFVSAGKLKVPTAEQLALRVRPSVDPTEPKPAG